ncbi:PRC-barrel domain-containing protein [Tabrizicola sp. BL-A-41-H6]|uniref:PRC-barrel domain-containing protein n=1 Tax=Tabrizicola sp. BL-A-41-H6 TaxID=3421107 RepID=UPI003D67B68B
MKTLLLGTAIALVLGSSASAQDLFRTEVDPTAITASDFIGKRVYAAEAQIDADEFDGVQQDWKDIGEINDVILTRDGRVDSVLVDIGGFLGMGERQVALSMESIRFVSDSATPDDMSDFFLVINADRTVLEGAPEYVRTNQVATDAGTSTDTAATATEGEATGAATEGAADDGTDGTLSEGANSTAATEGEAGGMAATESATDDAAAATDDAATAATESMAKPGEGYTEMDPTSLTADQLMGVRVYGQNDEDVGEISDIVLDDTGKAAQVIVDVGGFLGIGEKPVAIELSKMQIMQQAEGGALRAYVQMTQEELEGLPQR